MPNLAKKEDCTGCTACATICPQKCIDMEMDDQGFLFPSVSLTACIDCGLCEKTCPVLVPETIENSVTKAFAAYSKNETVRMQSSSGGIFTEIAREILERGGVVFGAAYNNCFEVTHICVETEDDLAKLRGAKYAQSDLQGIFAQVKERLDADQWVLFSGTPCQVAGLKAYLRRECAKLLLVDFVCHSVPSPLVWKEYVKYRAQQDHRGELPMAINLRSKETGWSRYRYSSVFAYKDGTCHMARNEESLYMKLFIGGYISRESCANCQFKGYHRISDLTLGDFWGIWNIAPEMDDDKGISVVLRQTARGAEILDRCKERLILREVTLEEASFENPAMIRAASLHQQREKAMALIRQGEIPKCEELLAKKKISLKAQLYSRLQSLIKRNT